MVLSPETLTILALASVALNVLLLFLFAAGRAAAKRGSRMPGSAGDLLAATLDGQGRTLDRVEAAIRQLAGEITRLDGQQQLAVQHVSVVRFDAFDDMGGRLSFSAAILDARGDGMVITGINGRQDTRVYAKPVRRGTSPHNLSDEEELAIREALAGARQTVEAAG
jgi:uncharacterized protein DUF4446